MVESEHINADWHYGVNDNQFGRVQRNNKGKVTLKTFDKNTQGEEFDKTKEVSARANWRKWDNIKHLAPLHKGFGNGTKKATKENCVALK